MIAGDGKASSIHSGIGLHTGDNFNRAGRSAAAVSIERHNGFAGKVMLLKESAENHRQLIIPNGIAKKDHINQIARAVRWLENNYKAPLKVNELAEYANMAVSTFHRNFKLMTTLSPLQFQKKLRLLEAQRLMLTEGADAANSAYDVGYESPAQFNREYKRMFGSPPVKDVKNILIQVG